jgi:hypothetical protein
VTKIGGGSSETAGLLRELVPPLPICRKPASYRSIVVVERVVNENVQALGGKVCSTLDSIPSLNAHVDRSEHVDVGFEEIPRRFLRAVPPKAD